MQASPARRALFAAAGRFTSAFTTLSGDLTLNTKREYSAAGLAALAYRTAATIAADKKSHLHHGKASGKGGSTQQGRWVRVAEYANSSWTIFDGECATLGVCATTLREKLQDR